MEGKLTTMNSGIMEGEETLPSYVMVNRQLQDLVKSQSCEIQRLAEDLSGQESFLKESFVAKESYEADISQIQKSLREDYVSRTEYEKLKDELQIEKMSHAQTKVKLSDAIDRLEFAIGENEILTRQLEREKASFEKAFGSLHKKTAEECSKSAKLQTKCSEIHKAVQEKDEEITNKEDEIRQLEHKLKQQEVTYKKKITDADVQRKQEQYIAQLMDNSRKINKGSEKSRTKAKQSKR